MFCNKCGHQFEGNFCPKCGAKAKTPPEVPVNTTGNFDEDKNDNPYDVYYKEQPNQAPYEPQYGYQPQKQEADTSHQTTYQQPYQQPYYPPYTNCPNCKANSKSLKWWQVLLIVITAILGYGLISGVLPIACIGCATIGCAEVFVDDSAVQEVCYINETFTSGGFTYTITDSDTIRKFAGRKARDGYDFVQVTFEITNISSSTDFLDYEVSCYAGDYLCNEILDEDYSFYYDELMPGKTYKYTTVFEIPEDAENFEIHLYNYQFEDGRRVKFILDK